jgi:ABC-2 type transport system ATP-binding protein
MDWVIQLERLVVDAPSTGWRRAPFRILDGMNLAVEAGQVYGFIGPNGAGKTTTIQVLLGFVKPASGTARLLDADVRHAAARRRIGFLPESPAFPPFLSGREFLESCGRFFGMSAREARRRAGERLEEMGLSEAADRRMGTYSRGMLQRVGLAQALINDPDLLLLDEPTGGMDPIARLEVRRWIARWRVIGKTVFFSSHELSEVERVCDKISLVVRGRIAAEGRPDELTRPGESLEQYYVRGIGEAGGGGAP